MIKSMNMTKLSLLIVSLMIMILGVLLVVYKRAHNKRKTHPKNFSGISKNLDSLNTDIKRLLNTVIGKDVVTEYRRMNLGIDKEAEIMECIHQKMTEKNIPLDAFKMDGDRMDTPIVKMYNENRELYDILASCNFLRMIGRTIGIIMYITYAQSSSTKVDSDKFGACMDKLGDFSDINIWNNIGTVGDMIVKCTSNLPDT